jgi:DNA polymerase-3 subunit delta'
MKKLDIIWQSDFVRGWRDRVERGRQPHAVMLLGPPGVGKRAAAAWLACQHLNIKNEGELPQYPFVRPEHADLRWIEPPEDKQVIGIEQIRELVGDVALTSYEGHGKVAVIEPANAMTSNAANSLLKTLEEPSGNALMILVTDRIGRLPATILSRCQRIEMLPPPASQGLAWLDRYQPGTAWAEALGLAGNAPLAAIEAHAQLEMHEAMSRDFAAVAATQASPVVVAEGWAKQEPSFVLNWLARQVQSLILMASGGPRGTFARGIDDSVLKRIDSRNLFCYLDDINRLRGQAAGSFNVQLALEGLLIDLADGLRRCRQGPMADGMRHLLMES